MSARRWVCLGLLASLLLGLGGTGVLADEAERLPVVDVWRSWVRLTGLVVSRPADDTVGVWVMGDRSLRVTETTVFDESRGPAVVGSQVLVIAQRLAATGTEDALPLEAILIRVLAPGSATGRLAMRGWITQLDPTCLVLNGLTIHYDRSTHIVGELRAGAMVKVVATQAADGWQALSIEALPRPTRVVYFQGAIQLLSRGLWIVGGQRVRIGQHTLIVGRPAIGLQAKVWALVLPQVTARSSRELLAIFIQAQDEPVIVEWTGKIERLPPNITIYPPTYVGQWLVGGRAVWVTRETEIVGTPRVGLQARVQAYRGPLRPLVAQKIEVLAVIPVTRAR